MHPIILFVNDPETLQLLNFFAAPWRARAAVIATVALTLLIATSIWREKLRIPYETLADLARHFCGDGGGVGPGPCLWGGQLPQPVLAGGVVGAVWVNGSVAADFLCVWSSPGR